MRRISPTSPSRQGGFTLLELIVVIFIIGIMTGFAVMSVGLGQRNETETEALRFKAILDLALEEAVLNSRDLGLIVNENGYQFTEYVGELWMPIEEDDLLRPRILSEVITLKLKTEDEEVKLGTLEKIRDEDLEKVTDEALDKISAESLDKVKTGGASEEEKEEGGPPPHVMLLSSGEIEPKFTVTFTHTVEKRVYQLDGNIIGKIAVTEPEAEDAQP